MPRAFLSKDNYGFWLLLRAAMEVEYSTFPRFKSLAIELQHSIWAFAVAAHGSRTVKVILKARWSKERNELWGSGDWSEVKASTNIPALLCATRDSRQIALRRWHLSFHHHLRHQPVYFDWKTDLLLFEKPETACWFHRHHIWNYRHGDDWDAEIKEIKENIKYVAVNITSHDTMHHHAELRHRYLVLNRYKNLEAFFLCSDGVKALLSKSQMLHDYFQHFNIIILHSSWVYLFRCHMKRGRLPYIIFVPHQEVSNNACIKWINTYDSR